MNRPAKVLRDQKNIGGDKIPEGTTVTMIGKNNDIKTCIDIRDEVNNITIYRVNPEDLELIK
jgi:hypothetical protein